ncbi:type III secretion system export apparatus subunit SctS [Luteimonas sp. MJ246]|uniref:type III secretion system export apparatus subunit SctS n=1 Tax=Luteimonas sp. MJ174 TaxID=3129237 RepID=UPI0031B9E02A
MNEVLELTKEGLFLVMLLSGPPIAAAALVGLVIAFLQAATQLQEQTFAYACKFLAIVLMLFLTAALIGGSLYNYTERIFRDFPGLVRK